MKEIFIKLNKILEEEEKKKTRKRGHLVAFKSQEILILNLKLNGICIRKKV